MILAIETSCDETAIAIISDMGALITQCLSSQIDKHNRYGGVVPELASRLHAETIHGLIERTLQDARITLSDVNAIAVTAGPGLEGALLVGMTAAKTLATVLGIPLIPVNHMQGHLYAYFIENEAQFPYLGLIVSGGHTQLVHVTDQFTFKLLGQTRDDAVGEAFDKVARYLGLGYPGGPEIEKQAKNGDSNAFNFPRAMKNNGYEFSFSGLKTAVLETTKQQDLSDKTVINHICASFQLTVCDILWSKVSRACNEFEINDVLITGGVAANQYLQSYFQDQVAGLDVSIWSLPPRYCTDNAAMIGVAGYYMQHHCPDQIIQPDRLTQIGVSPGVPTCI